MALKTRLSHLVCVLFALTTNILAQPTPPPKSNTSSIYITQSDTLIAVNFPPDSDDINFYISAPDTFQYAAIGFGDAMANAMMFVIYANDNRDGITISPRSTTGHTEPTYTPIPLTIHPSTSLTNATLIANATCHGCRSTLNLQSTSLPMIFAVGPALPLSSSDPDARLRRHFGYGHFTIDALHATGPGGIVLPTVRSSPVGASIAGPGVVRDTRKTSIAHGVLFVLAALASAPLDAIVARAKWLKVHSFTGGMYALVVLGGLVPGVLISREHVLTQSYATPHQVLGLLAIILLFLMPVLGIFLARLRNAAKEQGHEVAPRTKVMSAVHTWTGRFIWVLLLVNNGVGLKLAEEDMIFMLGYGAAVGAVLVFFIPIYFCVWRCTRPKRRRDKDESGHELPSIYNHDRAFTYQ